MSASTTDDTRPNRYQFSFGELKITIFLDGTVIRKGLGLSYSGQDASETVQALAKLNHIDPDRYEHPFTPMVVDTGKQVILFDTGSGTLSRDYEPLRGRLPAGALVERMRKIGYAPEDVDVVVITHGHFDHIGGLMQDGQPTFPKASYVVGAAEYDFWKRGENVSDARKFNRELFMKIVGPLAEKTSFISPGEDVVSGIRAVDASGHSAGMMAYLIESGGKRLLNWADTCGHYAISIQRPDLYLDVDDDKEKAATTRGRLLNMAAADELFVFGYHMPFPGIGLIERRGSGHVWVPHSYQLNI
ncbi:MULTISPECIES: MBL fold metallo-hydrolase [unclassified Beijerinckia]|uniref:MBL fold metallo-hydrolase n=1 Tax=unclassified Beijerinckia TaxID=2638183 RepID=UPI00089D85DB|nr:MULTISPECIES: MBL fold metallo-hydrolase [unclassified Beijerinckia]MDH7794227.1 glyoxylase-like metal-dependent hydrolase (beta-lactamase superfamily II) [Beijerinckia sp. GAS462]SEB56283.1 Glyoxylase, beta-lactamase superfamily II [Beijerinckia sp. 28-YEA-48]